MNTQFLPILKKKIFFNEILSNVLFFEVCMFKTSIDFPSNLTIYFDDHYYSCYHVPKKGYFFTI